MYPVYRDIREKLGTPLWHDSHGVPRYAEFHPKFLGIYDDYAALFYVQCQACSQLFPCASGTPKYQFTKTPHVIENIENFLDEYVGWGDAPWHDEDKQCSGTTMSTSIVKLLSVWERISGEWVQREITQSMTDLVTDW